MVIQLTSIGLKQGGPLTITDANVHLGRVRPEYFPKIFGKQQNEPIDVEATRAAFERFTAEINAWFVKQAESKGLLSC